MRASLPFALVACAALIGCNNQPDQQVTGLPSTPPLKATPTPSEPLFAYSVSQGRGAAHAGAGIVAFTIDYAKGTIRRAQTLPFNASDLPSRIAVEPTRKFAYVLGAGSNRVRVYSVDAKTGALTLEPKASFAAGKSPVAIGVAPSGSSLYVADSGAGSGRVYQFMLNPSDGSVTPMQRPSVSLAVNPTAVTIDPGGRFVYFIDKDASEVQFFGIDSATGELKAGSKPMPAGDGPLELTIDATSKYAYVVSNAGISPFAIGDDGSLKAKGAAFGAATEPKDIDFDPSGTSAYVSDAKGIATYGFDLANGALKMLSEIPVPSSAPAVCTTTGSRFIFVTATDPKSGASTIDELTIDEDTGNLKPVAHASAAAGYDAECLVVAGPQ